MRRQTHEYRMRGSVDSSTHGNSTPKTTPQVRGVLRVLYLLVAGSCCGLALFGAILPGLPTTPFLLLASYCLVRSSPKLNSVLLHSRFFGPILNEWQTRGSVQKHIKVKAIVSVIIAVSLSTYLTPAPPFMIATICITAGLGICVILRIPTS